MRALVVAESAKVQGCSPSSCQCAEISGQSVVFRIMDVDLPPFDPDSPENADMVLVRVTAFSLNYRDRAWIRDRSRNTSLAPVDRAVGSEFAGYVIATGSEVQDFREGDRVMADMSWPTNGVPGAVGGVPTNAASIENLRIHHGKLTLVPDEMTDAAAASFVLGAQTAHGLERRAEVQKGEPVLITAATSSTSLFTAQALRAGGARVSGLTRSTNFRDRLLENGFDQIFDAADLELRSSPLHDYVKSIRGFRAVVDPFSDLYLHSMVPMLGFFGRYVTCGVMDQGMDSTPATPANFDLSFILNQLIVKNLTIMGNCLGFDSDLNRALDRWAVGEFDPVMDSSHTDLSGFIQRTFASDRFGKVVFKYSQIDSIGRAHG